MSNRNIKTTLAYNGTDFRGWQVQAEGRTVQGTVMAALERMHGHPVRVCAAGRTDSGVHADGQVINFFTDLDSIPAERFFVALNSYLPRDVKALATRQVETEFHARYWARERVYRYYLDPSPVDHPRYFRFSVRLRHHPDPWRLNEMARLLVGTHDFTTFTVPRGGRENRVRTVRMAAFFPEGRFLVFQIAANAFLWRMVRSLVGTLLDLDKQGADPVEVERLLEVKDHAQAGPSAPARGLTLYQVEYYDADPRTLEKP